MHDPVTERLAGVVDEWKGYMPVLLDLGNPAMKDRHWKRVFDQLNRPYAPDMEFTTEQLLNYGVMNRECTCSHEKESIRGRIDACLSPAV